MIPSRYALNGIKSAALVARKTENFFFSGVQLGIRQRLGEAKIDLPIDIELDDSNDDTWLIPIRFIFIFTYARCKSLLRERKRLL